MWNLSNLRLETATIDNSLVTQLWDGKTRLINAIEQVNWNDRALQFEICEHCGIVGCQPQGWIELKRSNNLALIIPAFSQIEDAPTHLRDEYLPPAYLNKGAIAIDPETYTQLCQLAPFPEFETLPALTAWEAIKVFQLEAPILGNIRDQPKLDRDLILASSKGSFIEQTTELISLLQNNTQSIQLRKVTERDTILTFYLDLAGSPRWRALIYADSQYSFYLEPGYVVDRIS